MSQIIRAIYEDGVFKPLQKPDLSDREQVQLTVESAPKPRDEHGVATKPDPLDGVRVATGISDLAQNFDDYRFGGGRK